MGTIGKRLLQHERSGQGGLGASGGVRLPVGVTVNLDVEEVGKEYFGVENGKIAEPALRDEAIRWRMNDRALKLSQQRASEESQSGQTPGAVTSQNVWCNPIPRPSGLDCPAYGYQRHWLGGRRVFRTGTVPHVPGSPVRP